MNKTLSQSMLTTLFLYWNIEISLTMSNGRAPYNKESSSERSAVTCPVICECIGNKAKCNDVGKNVTVIPRLPSYIHDIEFSGNYLPNVTKETFAEIASLNLEKLNISRNEIKEISVDAFYSLKHLQILDMSLNKFSCNILQHALNGIKNSKIKTIKLNGMNWTDLESGMFHALHKTNISSLTLAENQLSKLNGLVFAELKQLKYLDVSDNVIYSLYLRGLESLKYLDLHGNDISRSYIFCNIEKGWIQNIEYLNLQGNHLRSVKSITFGCLKKLKYLNLNENPIETLENNTLVQMKSLATLSLSYLYQINKIEEYAFKSKSLKNLFFSNNNFRFGLNSKPKRIFKHCPKLEQLDLSYNYLEPPLKLSKIFSKNLALRTINLRKTRLNKMPLNFFARLQNLTKLILNGNRISSWSGKQVFGKSTSLREIYLKRNHITVVNETSFPPSLLSSLKILDLADNQISCTCDNLWFRDWIREHKYKNITLLGYPKNYRCMSPPKMRDDKVLFVNYNPTKQSCAVEPLWMYAIISVTCLIVLTITTILILYKCRWNIRYKIYLMKRHTYAEIPTDEDFVYVGYVIYSDCDREWVHGRFRSNLEDNEGLRLCVRLRDFEAGKSIVDNIAENMNLSREVIIVISNNFAKDEWCQFEFNLAQNRLVKDGKDFIIVMLDEVNSDNLYESLHALITTKSYALWSEEDTGKTLFWEQVINALKIKYN